MERGSDKHSGRMDDALKVETAGMMAGGRDTHAEEWKSAEPSGEDQPEVSLDPTGAIERGTPEGMSQEDVEARSELAAWLGRASFPAVRELLLEHVLDNGAPDHVVAEVRRLPAGREFINAGDAWRALHAFDSDGEHVETRRF